MRGSRVELRAVCPDARLFRLQGVAGHFHDRLSSTALSFEGTIRALDAELDADTDTSEAGLLRELVVRDIASLRDLLNHIDEVELQRAVRIMERADTLFLAGQNRSAPVVELLRYGLTMLGQRVTLLDAGGGLATHMARTMRPRDALVAVSFRYYAKEVLTVAAEARGAGVPVIALTDTTLSPLARAASVLFTVPEHDYAFSRSLAAPMCLAQALIVALAARLGDDGDAPRIPVVTQE